MNYLWLIIGLSAVFYLFWLQRKQDEYAFRLARSLCQQQQVQFLDCARSEHSLGRHQGRLHWQTCYQVSFSSDGESRYQAELYLNGFRLQAFQLPPHRI